MQSADRKLEAVKPENLRSVWLEIRDEVASVESPDGFIPEDVYALCRSSEAVLFTLHDGERIGWMVLRQFGADLHIWLLYAENGFDVMTVFRKELMDLARTAKASMLTFGTKRKGWEKVAPKHGFKVRQVIYECVVD